MNDIILIAIKIALALFLLYLAYWTTKNVIEALVKLKNYISLALTGKIAEGNFQGNTVKKVSAMKYWWHGPIWASNTERYSVAVFMIDGKSYNCEIFNPNQIDINKKYPLKDYNKIPVIYLPTNPNINRLNGTLAVGIIGLVLSMAIQLFMFSAIAYFCIHMVLKG